MLEGRIEHLKIIIAGIKSAPGVERDGRAWVVHDGAVVVRQRRLVAPQPLVHRSPVGTATRRYSKGCTFNASFCS